MIPAARIPRLVKTEQVQARGDDGGEKHRRYRPARLTGAAQHGDQQAREERRQGETQRRGQRRHGLQKCRPSRSPRQRARKPRDVEPGFQNHQPTDAGAPARQRPGGDGEHLVREHQGTNGGPGNAEVPQVGGYGRPVEQVSQVQEDGGQGGRQRRSPGVEEPNEGKLAGASDDYAGDQQSLRGTQPRLGRDHTKRHPGWEDPDHERQRRPNSLSPAAETLVCFLAAMCLPGHVLQNSALPCEQEPHELYGLREKLSCTLLLR